jgi:AraC-like DNA-binding protein
MAEPTVGAGFARGLFDFAVAKGAPREALLAAAGIDAGDLADQEARIPFISYVMLMRTAKAMTGDPALALHFGEAVNIADVSIVGLIGDSCATMIESFHQLNRYVRLVVETGDGGPPSDRFVLDRSGGELWLVDTRPMPNLFPELTESAFSQLVCRARRVADRSVLAVHVTHPDPGYADEYARIFRAPVTFEAERNAMLLPADWAEHPVGLLPRYVFGILSERAESLLKSLEGSSTTRGRVESLVMPVLHTGEVNKDGIASRMGLSRQTLFRKLKAEGTSFERLLDELRHKLSLHYLAGKKVSVNETAYLVGFSDPAAFSRAFKRWTGASPKSMRAADGASATRH